MKNFKIKDEEGQLLVEFDGEEWKFFESPEEDPRTLDHDLVERSPFYLYRLLEEVGDPAELMIEMSQKSPELKNLIDNFFAEKFQMKERIVLLENYGYGMVDSFIDRLTLTGDIECGFILESTIETEDYIDDWSYYESVPRNAFGELVIHKNSNPVDAADLYEAIVVITSDDEYLRWDNVNWEWDEIISNLKPHFPTLVKDLERIVKESQE